MIKVTLYYNKQKDLCRFKLYGHAQYAEYGQDIVCAGVSMIVINTINSIESFTNEPLVTKHDADTGWLECTFPEIQKGKGSEEAKLLLKSMVLGLGSVKEEYGSYIQIDIHQGGE